MTEPQFTAAAMRLADQASQLFDGFVVVGFRADTGEAFKIIRTNGHEAKTVFALSMLIQTAASTPGFVQDRPDDLMDPPTNEAPSAT